MTIKLLIGGSPCTHWSIAQKNNRETEPSGMGWELFKNYLIAKEKFKPDFFLYENNKSAAQAIKDQIAKELGVGVDPKVRFTYINSALVSAQNRQRFYVTNFGDIEQPKDRGILLKDILESGIVDREKGYCLLATHGKKNQDNYFNKYQGQIAFEPLRIGTIENESKNKEHDSKQYRVYSPEGKSTTLCALGGGVGAKTGLYACPVEISQTIERKQRSMVAEPIECFELDEDYYKGGLEGNLIGQIINNGTYKNGKQPSQQYRVYTIYGKSICVDTDPRKYYICPATGNEKTIYQVRDGLICIKGKQYPINLPDGFYIIRKLTVTECCRLQTLPDDYCKAVSATQAYKALGNGWTAEVIIHLLNHALKDVPRNEEIVVLSLYDGIGTGRYCLDKMGFTNVKYHAYEIDKYPMAIANDNYPDIIQHGDAFAVREDSWKPPKTRSEWLDELLGVGK
jgi:site-specific DNA-cytosine methylase